MFICSSCEAVYEKWIGKCTSCGAWNTIAKKESVQRRGISNVNASANPFETLTTLDKVPVKSIKRIGTGSPEFDRTLGGGLVPASLVLMAGEPGIGKSTLILQTLALLADNGLRTLYVSGEESMAQIKLRAERVGCSQSKMNLLSETSLNNIIKVAEKIKPDIIVIDSIQTIYNEDGAGTPSSVGQINECILMLMVYAKKTQTIILVVGHVTKDGEIAGTKKLEHIVDAAIHFEGDKKGQYRILRAIKNRFGSTDEIGVFEMKSDGIKSVPNPSSVFMGKTDKPLSGSVVGCTIEGTRALLFEVQSLVGASSYSMPQRVAAGIETKKLTIIIALIERFCQLNLSMADIFVSVAGGLKIEDSGVDLSIALSIISGALNVPMPHNTLALGELGLSGETRAVSNIDIRIKEACRLGYQKIIIPPMQTQENKDLEIIKVHTLLEAAERFFSKESIEELKELQKEKKK